VPLNGIFLRFTQTSLNIVFLPYSAKRHIRGMYIPFQSELRNGCYS